MHKLPDLPYSYDALEPFLDAKTLEIHHDKHHATYVANLNKFLESCPPAIQDMDLASLMKHLSEVPEQFRTAVRNNLGGVYNHTLYWSVLGKGKGGKPKGELLAAVEKDFGSFESFQEKFEAAALGRFGSGWAWLNVNNGRLSVISTANQDNPMMDNLGTPVFLIDVWEHAYYLKYQNRRAEYVKAFWNVVNWDEVARLYKEAKK